MLRAVRLAAKLGLEIEPATRAPIRRSRTCSQNVPPSRLFDEMLKLLLSGHARECVRSCARKGCTTALLPLLDVDPRAAARRALRHARAARAPTSACARTSRCRPASCSRRCCGTRCWPRGRSCEAKGDASRCRRCTRRWTSVDAARRRRSSRSRAASARRHEGDLGAAAALPAARAAGGPSACSSIRAFAPATISCSCAAKAARWTPQVGEWWRTFPACRDEERERCCCPVPAAPAPAPPRAAKPAAATPAAEPAPAAERPDGRSRDRRGTLRSSRWAAISTTRASRSRAALAGARRAAARRELLARSSLYRTAPVGYVDQPDFVNAVAVVETALAPAQLLDALLAIERRHGRVREFPNAPRTLDLDLLLYGDRGPATSRARRSAPAHARARLRAGAAGRDRARRGHAGRGTRRRPACRGCAAISGVEQARCCLSDYRYIVVEGPIGAGKTSLARVLGAARLRATPAARGSRREPVPARASTRTARATRCATQLFFLFQRVNQLSRR